MSDFSMLHSNLQSMIRRSMGLKLIAVCGLAVLMIIPALMVGNLVEDRTKRAAAVVNEISGLVGGPQTFLGPTLAIPYTIRLSCQRNRQSMACTWCSPHEPRLR